MKDGMRTDRELLELAAKAAGLAVRWGHFGSGQEWLIEDSVLGGLRPWRPLSDGGDALRLSVTLKISVVHDVGKVSAERWEGDDNIEHYGEDGDPYAATCRAIVRAAAAIGEAMP